MTPKFYEQVANAGRDCLYYPIIHVIEGGQLSPSTRRCNPGSEIKCTVGRRHVVCRVTDRENIRIKSQTTDCRLPSITNCRAMTRCVVNDRMADWQLQICVAVRTGPASPQGWMMMSWSSKDIVAHCIDSSNVLVMAATDENPYDHSVPLCIYSWTLSCVSLSSNCRHVSMYASWCSVGRLSTGQAGSCSYKHYWKGHCSMKKHASAHAL